MSPRSKLARSAALLASLALFPLLGACSREESPRIQAEIESAPEEPAVPAPAPLEAEEPAAPDESAPHEPALAEPAPHEGPVITRGTPEPPTQAILKGFVFDANGRVVSGARVLVVAGAAARTPRARIAGGSTDSEGAFRIAVAPGTEGDLLVVADGWLPHVEPLAPREAGEHQLGAVPLEEGAFLAGIAEGCAPRGVVYASLQASYQTADYQDVSDLAWIDGVPVKTYVYGRTDGEEFRLGGLVPGAYRVGAQRTLLGGDCRADDVGVQQSFVDAPSTGLVLRDDDPAVRVEVLAEGQPLAGARVSLDGKGPCVTSGLGVVYWRVVDGRSYTLRIEADGYGPVEVEVAAPARGEYAQLPVKLEKR